MTTPPNPDVSEDGIHYGHLFAMFTEGAEDGSVDLDPYPNENWLSGSVTLRPSFDGRATNAALRVPGTPRSRGMVIDEVGFDVAASRLVDRQGREGVWLIIQVGDIPIHWQATVILRDKTNKVILQTAYILTADSWVTEPNGQKVANLPDLIPNPRLLTPPEGAALLSAQASMNRALDVAAALEAALPAINAADDYAAAAAGSAQDASNSAAQAGTEADRAIGLADAEDSVVAGHVATDGRQTQTAVDGRIEHWQETTGNATYAKVIQIVSDGTDQTATINAAARDGWVYGAKRTVKLIGDFTVTSPIILPSNTTLDATDATVTKTKTSFFNLVTNEAKNGTGPRDHDIYVVGGQWSRSGEAGPGTANDAHSFLFHRVDRVGVRDMRFHGEGTIKYAVYFVDCTGVRSGRLDMNSTSDGVHVTGPASDVYLWDIAGNTHDDLVSFTGRDYDNYELTPGGGDLSNITVENITLRSGDGNTVKLLPGLGKTLSTARVRNISGNPNDSAVILCDDAVLPSTTGGTIKDVVIDGVGGAPVNGFLVNVSHKDVQGVKIRNLDISKATMARAVAFSGSGGVVKAAAVDGVSSNVAFTGNVVAVGTGMTVESLQVSNISVQQGASPSLGSIVASTGNIGTVQMANINQSGGRALVDVAGGTCRYVAVQNLHSTAQIGVFLNAVTETEVQVSGVTSHPSAGLTIANASGCTLTLRGQGLTGEAVHHITRNYPATLRAVGAEVRADVSKLSPQAGDIVHNTNSAAAPTGAVIYTGASWRSLQTEPPVKITRSWDLPNIEPSRSADVTASFAAGTVAPGDFVKVVPPADLPAGLVWSAFVSAPNIVTLRVANMTASAINPAPATWTIAVNKT